MHFSNFKCSIPCIRIIQPKVLRFVFTNLYPFWMSLKALNNEIEQDYMLWLTYWIFYCIINTIENMPIINMLDNFAIFYYGLTMVYIYLYSSNMKGGIFLYHKFLPILIRLEQLEEQIRLNTIQFTESEELSYDPISYQPSNVSLDSNCTTTSISTISSSEGFPQIPVIFKKIPIRRSESDSIYKNYPIQESE